MSPYPGSPEPLKSSADVVDVDNDPFADWVFREPRQPHYSVRELNDGALRRLLGRFDRLVAGPLPRPNRRLDQAQLVVSPQPGYGKSHLIGRLFAALEGFATLIYVTPFHSPSLCWQSILLRTVQELSFPDRRPRNEPVEDVSVPDPGNPPTQLDAFAHGVLAHLVAGLIESGRVHHDDPSGAAAWLRENPLEAFMLSNPDHPWASWLQEVFETFQRDMEAVLCRVGLSMHSPGWLRVLFRYAASQPGDAARAHCVAWMSGQPLEPAEAALIGLRPGELTPAETPDQINELCWRRLLDFCQLAAFYRPFVFCFDQTETYGHSPALARCFGMVIAQIHLLAANEMMVVTANQQPWEETVARYMETADKDRFIPLPLEGIRRAQAEELVRWRCRQHDVPMPQVEAFLGGNWLPARFPTERNRVGTRQFLQACSTRWQNPEAWWHQAAEASPELPFAIPEAAAPFPAATPAPLPIQPSMPVLAPILAGWIPKVGRAVATGRETPLIIHSLPIVSARRAASSRSLTPAAATAPGSPSLALPDLHDCYVREAAGESRRLAYHPDTFRWLVAEVVQGSPGIEIEVQPEGARSHLPVTWTLAAHDVESAPRQVLFGFEPGDNWKRWRSILREAQDRCLPPPLSPSGGKAAPPAKAVFLRTPEQSPVPGPGWEIGPELESARLTCFDVIELDATAVAELYAAHALYLDAAAGDLSCSTEEVLSFLRVEMAPLWERICQAMPGEPESVLSTAAATM